MAAVRQQLLAVLPHRLSLPLAVAACRRVATTPTTTTSTTPTTPTAASTRYPTVGVAVTVFPRHPATGALVLSHVCLIQRGTEPLAGAWCFPGGKLEWGEDMAAGAVREAREETGLTVTVVHRGVPAYAATDALTLPTYHYGIVHVLAAVDATLEPRTGALTLPRVTVGDDARAGRWVATGFVHAPPGGGGVSVEYRGAATSGAVGGDPDVSQLHAAGALVPFVRDVLALAPAAAAARGIATRLA